MKDVSFEKCDEVEDAFEMNDINEERRPLPTNDKVKTSSPALQILQCVMISSIPSRISNAGEHDFQEVTLTPLER